MPLELRGNEVALIGTCGADEALEFVELLAQPELPTVDLSACTNLHSALLQSLLAFRPVLSSPPADEFLGRWVLPLLSPGPDGRKEPRP